MSWEHGYFTGIPYTANFFREVAPLWIDFAALLRGHPSPRPREGAAFTYLELGSGMGMGLCILAAAHPEGTFTGIDFMPEHIAHSRELARRFELANVRFLEADLLDLATDPSPLHRCGVDPASCEYVVAHGLLSWVSESVQSALLAVASAFLTPEGFFYGSYNTYPGWLSMTTFQHLVRRELARSDPSDPSAALNRSAGTLRSLLGTREGPTALGQAHPFLQANLQHMPIQQPAYLVQEYANEHWHPLFVAELHQRCHSHKLRYIATATLPDLFEGLLPEPGRSIIQDERNPTHRQTLLDLATNRAFRRDLFSRGSRPLREGALQERLELLMVRLQEAPAQASYQFQADFGEVSGNPPLYSGLEAALAEGPRNLGELAERLDHPLAEIAQAVALLLHANRVGLDRSHCDAFPQAQANAERVNAYLLSEIQAGAPYAHLMAPTIGSGVSISPLEALLLEALRQGLEGNVLAACVQMGLQGLNVELREKDGKPLTTDAARRKAILRAAEAFASQRLPFLRSLGVVPS